MNGKEAGWRRARTTSAVEEDKGKKKGLPIDMCNRIVRQDRLDWEDREAGRVLIVLQLRK